MHNINMSDIRDVYARRLKEVRERRGFTQEEVALEFGKSQGWLSNIERGVIDPPALVLAAQFSQKYGVTTDYLLGLSDEESGYMVLRESRVEYGSVRNPKASLIKIIEELTGRRQVELLVLAETMKASDESEEIKSTEMMLGLIDNMADGEARQILMRARDLYQSGNIRGAVKLVYNFFWRRGSDQSQNE